MMRSWRKAIGAAVIFVATVCAAAGPLGSDPRAARAFLKELIEPTPLGPDARRLAGKLLADLGSERWSARDAASKGLLRIGAKAGPLVGQAVAGLNPEAASRAEQLLAAYKASREDRPAVLNKAVDILVGEKDETVVDSLVRLLGHEDEQIRRAAEYAVRRITGKRFGYNAHSPADERRAAAARWAAWWKAGRADFDFDAIAGGGRVGGVFCWDPYTSRAFLFGLDGEAIWARKVPKRFYGADVLPNGNVLVGAYDGRQTVLEEYDPGGEVVWRAKGVPFSGTIRDVTRLPNGQTLVIDLTGRRLVEIDPTGERIVWEHRYGTMGVCSAQRLTNGNTLLCSVRGEVQEITRAGKVVWRKTGLGHTRDAQKLPNGNVLIVDPARRSVVELGPGGREVWSWTSPDGRATGGAVRLPDGRTAVQIGGVGFLLVDLAGTDAIRLATPENLRVYSCGSCRRQLRLAPAGAERAAKGK